MSFCGKNFFFNYGTLLSLVTFLGRGVGGIRGGGLVSDLKRPWSRDISLPRALLIPNN